MNNFRVITDGKSYRIEYVDGNYIVGIPSAASLEELKTRLKEMLAACDKPPLFMFQELREWETRY